MKENPFRFGAPVEGVYYFERPALHASCESLLANGISIMLVGSRRFGKTSFVKNFCHRWEEKKHGDALLIDVYNVTSHQDFLLQILRPLQSRQPLMKKLKGLMKKSLPSSVTVGNESLGSMTLNWLAEKNEQEKKLFIQETLEALVELDGKVCLVIDECQQISKDFLKDEGWLEATLRHYIQHQAGKVAYLLTGSRRDVIHAMVNDNARPLYRACQVIDFPPLEENFTHWITMRFASVGIKCSKEAITYLRSLVNESPNYVQMVCYHLVAMGCDDITKTDIDTAISNIVPQNAYSYDTHLQNLSSVQQRVLRMLALEEEGYFSETMLQRYEINSTAHVTNAIHALKKKNILDQETSGRGKVAFDDPLFRLWLRYRFGGYRPINHQNAS